MKSKLKSNNVIDARNARANDIISKASTSPRQTIVSAYRADAAPSPMQVQSGKALGLGPQLSAMQNYANKVQARRRTRIPVAGGTDNEITKSAKDLGSLLRYAKSKSNRNSY